MISVVTPCLNICKDGREEYFHKMMRSVHEQTYQNIEHIIVDGGSTDGTLSILKQYQAAGWITCLVSEKDKGIYQAMNKGMMFAKGDYVNFMNTDDYFADNDFFSRSISEIEKHNVDFSHADRIVKSRDGKADFIKKGDERVAFFRMPFRFQTLVVKKSVFIQLGSFDEKYEIASDYKYILQMLLANKKGVYLPKIYVCSLGGGVSANREKCIEEVSEVLWECYGNNFNLSKVDCRNIYLRNFSFLLLIKIIFLIKNTKIKNSLIYGYRQRLLNY